jgi:Flp pilus assembly pilin Flp
MQFLRQKGQGMTEYIIIVALIAIAAIGVYTAFGKTVRGQMAVTAQALGGNDTEDARTETEDAGDAAVGQAARDIQLNDYDNQ